jgi:hypothetical protein
VRPDSPVPLPLGTALASGKISASFRGTGGSSGDAVLLTVQKTATAGAAQVVLAIPAGTMLRSAAGGSQNMVVNSVRGIAVGPRTYRRVSNIVLSDNNPVTVVLSAYCAEFEKDNPTEGGSFTLDERDPALACILNNAKGLSVPSVQAAVWVHTDRITYQRMSAKFRISLQEFQAGQAVADQCVNTR